MSRPPLTPILTDVELSEQASQVFADIRQTRQTEFINNFWRVLASDPALLARSWAEVRDVMAPGELDPLVKELIYIAVSTTNGCEYCIRSHSAAARARGATDGMLAELRSVITAAARTNSLATGLQVPIDPEFLDG